MLYYVCGNPGIETHATSPDSAHPFNLGVTFVSAATSQTLVPTYSNGVVSLSVDSMVPGATVTLTSIGGVTVDPTNGIIIDNGDACFQQGGPSAYLRSVTTAGYQDNLVWTHTTDDATESNYATWNLYFAAAGTYKVEAYTDTAYAQSKQAKYVITGVTHTTSSSRFTQVRRR